MKELKVKVYDGYGDADDIIIYGHVLRERHHKPRVKASAGWVSNAIDVLRLFLVRPVKGALVSVDWMGQIHEAHTDEEGFFMLQWKPHRPPPPGWHAVTIRLKEAQGLPTNGAGNARVFSPHGNQYALVSDIDDTFLVSHSSNWIKRFRTLLTHNPETRRSFEGVVEHYRALSMGTGTHAEPNPIFYVSSSEWNLYDYLRAFLKKQGLPDGILLLSPLKRITHLWKTGQGKHSLKFVRIARIMKSYPNHRYILLGDDSQQDPYIYAKIVEHFPTQVHAIYIRHVRRSSKPKVDPIMARFQQAGIHSCYFVHSREALAHSRRNGLAL